MPPKPQYIPGTSIEYRPPRDIWREQGYTVIDNHIQQVPPEPQPSRQEPQQPERKPFWRR